MNSNLKRVLSVVGVVLVMLVVLVLIVGRISGLAPVLAAGSLSSTFGLIQCALVIALLVGLLAWFKTRRADR